MLTKKIIAVFIAVLMIFSSLSLAVSATDAFDSDYEIKYGETITVSVPLLGEEFVYVKFVPESDGAFSLTSDSAETDPYCDMYDAQGEYLDSADDCYLDYNFDLRYSFTAGETYYFALADYMCESQWEITLSCAHEYGEDGKCEYCDSECPHDTSKSFISVCDCGKVFTGNDIEAGAELDISVPGGDEAPVIFRFIPAESGTYLMKSVDAQSDPYCDLYNEYGEWVSGNDDASLEDVGWNFVFAYYFEAGETYYFCLSDYNEDAEYKVTFDKATHETADGIHELEYVEAVEGSCIEPYYTEGLYCPVCDEYIVGHQEYTDVSHTDDDWDDICDICGAELWYDIGDDDIYDDIYESIVNFDFMEMISFIVDAVKFLKQLVLDIIFGIIRSGF